MPTPCLWIDPNDPNLKRSVDALPATPGYCIFIDITGSTAMKQQGIHRWISLIHNCFANAELFLHPFSPIKGIGDALMFYIEALDLLQSGYIPLQVFDGLWEIATNTDPLFPVVKIGAAKCEQVYPMTFLRGNQDYYGIDIDLTARLQSLAREREVVIERQFYEAITANYLWTDNKEQFESYRALTGPTQEKLKGIPDVVEVFRTGGV
jgi:class 3 adenylate cyclase